MALSEHAAEVPADDSHCDHPIDITADSKFFFLFPIHTSIPREIIDHNTCLHNDCACDFEPNCGIITTAMPDKNYSHRDVIDKLGIQPGCSVRVVGRGEATLLARVRAKTRKRLSGDHVPADVILFWPTSVGEIIPTLSELRRALKPAGGIWVITAKRSRSSTSGMAYVSHQDLIPHGLAAGLVDNKICSLSADESAMRFVIRKKDRVAK